MSQSTIDQIKILSSNHVNIVIYRNLLVFISMFVLFSSAMSFCSPINSNLTEKHMNQQQKYLATSGNNIIDSEIEFNLKYLSKRSQEILKIKKLSKRAAPNNKLKATPTTSSPVTNNDEALILTRELVLEKPQSTVIKKQTTLAPQTKNPPKLNISNYFREEIDNYPEEEIKLILTQTPNEVKELFNVLNTPLDPNMNLTERVAHHYNEKEGNNNEASDVEGYKEESVCKSVIRNIYPREANKNNAPVYVPNTQEFMQVIQAEICQYPNQECNYLQDSLPYGMTSSCQQKYAYKKLLYLDPLEKRMATDLFRYPSCCTCYVRHSPIDSRSIHADNNNNSSSKLLLSNNKNNNSNISVPTTIIYDESSNIKIQPSLNHIQDTEIISNNTSSTTIKRQPKALLNDSNNSSTVTRQSITRITSPTKPPHKISTSTLIEDQIFSSNNKNLTNNSRVQKQTSVANLLNSTQHTVILQEDKVYKPDSEYRRKK